MKSHNGFIQFQLWRECQQKCAFCYNNELNEVDKLFVLDFAIDRLTKDDIGTEYTQVGFIGGEFFAGQLKTQPIKDKFHKLIDSCISLIDTGKVSRVYITTNLMYRKLDQLEEVIDKFVDAKCLDKLMICTSYDTKYRFPSSKVELLWKYNVDALHSKYPGLDIHVETILTEHFISSVVGGEFNTRQFCDQFRVSIDFIDCQYFAKNMTKDEILHNMPDFVPTRMSFLKFVRYLIETNQYDVRHLLDRSHHSNLVYIESDGFMIAIGDRNITNEQLDSYYRLNGRMGCKIGYIDSDVNMLDDIRNMLDVMK